MTQAVLGPIKAISIVTWRRFDAQEPPIGALLLVSLRGYGSIRQLVYVGGGAYVDQGKDYDMVNAEDTDVWALLPYPWKDER